MIDKTKLNATSLQNIDTAVRFTQISLAGAERLFNLQFQIGRSLLEEQVRVLRDLAGTNPQEAATKMNKLSVAALEQAVSNSRSLYEIVAGTQSELSKLAEEQAGQVNRSTASAIDMLAKNAPAGSDVAVNALKSSAAAAAAAVSSMSKAAQQVDEFAEASVKAASTATTDAVKNAAIKATPAA